MRHFDGPLAAACCLTGIAVGEAIVQLVHWAIGF